MTTSSVLRPGSPFLPFQSMDPDRVAARSGRFAKVGVALAVALEVTVFVSVLVTVTVAMLLAVLMALCVVAVRGAWHAVAPRSGAHRADRGAVRPGVVIDVTSRVLRNAAPTFGRGSGVGFNQSEGPSGSGRPEFPNS